MENSGEFISQSAEERIRRAALLRLLDAQESIEVQDISDDPDNARSTTFALEANYPEDDDLSIISILLSYGPAPDLIVSVSHFKKNPPSAEPQDFYSVTGYTMILFPDAFSPEKSRTIGDDELPTSELDKIAIILENENVIDLDHDDFESRTREMDEAVNKNFNLISFSSIYGSKEKPEPDNSHHESRVRKAAAKLIRALRF